MRFIDKTVVSQSFIEIILSKIIHELMVMYVINMTWKPY